MFQFSIKRIEEKLQALYANTQTLDIGKRDRIVIFSDLHLGEGGKSDDFENNGDLFENILRDYYLKKDYRLILNGDIDELLRFNEQAIIKRWKNIYDLFEAFHQRGKLVKIFGNHDIELKNGDRMGYGIDPVESIKLNYDGHGIFIFHGHQAAPDIQYNATLIKPILRFLAKPLGIKNYLVANNSKKKYQIERIVYDFAKRNKLVSIIGHTHRPLFESMSKKDSLKFKIENLCRLYPEASAEEKIVYGKKIELYKGELISLIEKKSKEGYVDTLYNTDLFVPCMFNSGSCIGKRGLTAIEIADGQIKLMYWFDKIKTDKYFDFNGHQPEQLGNLHYYNVTLKDDQLDYLFTRIKLLS